MTGASALYVGEVGHWRLRPRRHSLRYRIFMLLLDVDALPDLGRRLRWFSLGRFNLTSFHARDYGDGSDTPLRTQVERRLDAAGLSIDGGPIRLLTLPRVLGYAFNPISTYYCHRPDGRLHAVLYEVTSTFGERHSYLASVESGPDGLIRQSALKRLHVSPFMGMDMTYDFRLREPDETLRLEIEAADGEGVLLFTHFIGRRRDLTDRALLSAWFRHPLVTLKVILGIHWEAVKLIAKGLRLRPGPPAPIEGWSAAVAQTRRYSIQEPSAALALSADQTPASSYQSMMSASPESAKAVAGAERPSP